MTTLLRLINSQLLPTPDPQFDLVAKAPFQPGGHQMVAPTHVQTPGRKLFSATKNMLEKEDPLFIADGDRGLVLRDGAKFRAFGEVPKQDCYIPFKDPNFPAMPGFIDLFLTNRVIGSQKVGSGAIRKLINLGLITTLLHDTADLAAPMIATTDVDEPTPNDLTITGTNFESTAPFTSEVLITGTGGPLTLSKAAILGAGGTFTDMTIEIPAVLIPGTAIGTSFAQVVADGQGSNLSPFVEIDNCFIAAAILDFPAPFDGNVLILGADFESFMAPPAPEPFVLAFATGGPPIMPKSVILGAGGFYSDTVIFIPAVLVGPAFHGISAFQVSADGALSNGPVVTP